MDGRKVTLGLLAMLAMLAAAGVMVCVIFFMGIYAYQAELAAATQPAVDAGLEDAAATSPATMTAATQTADMPAIPVEMNVPFRHLSDQGFIAQFHNTSNKLLRVVITMESDTSHTNKTEALEIPAQATIELGWDRGWRFGPGDRVGVTCDGYKGMAWTMPGM